MHIYQIHCVAALTMCQKVAVALDGENSFVTSLFVFQLYVRHRLRGIVAQEFAFPMADS